MRVKSDWMIEILVARGVAQAQVKPFLADHTLLQGTLGMALHTTQE